MLHIYVNYNQFTIQTRQRDVPTPSSVNKAVQTLQTQDTSDLGHFGTGAEVSGHFGTSL